MSDLWSRPRFVFFGVIFFLAAVLPGLAQDGGGVGPADSIYFLITDRFLDADESNNYTVRKSDVVAYQGGDFEGIIQRLDYIQALGMSTIWISPVVDNQSGGYHGYWARDFYAVEEHFGTMETLKRLVDEAHTRGMKVIIDLVVNHSGNQHPFLTDPEYADWFHPRLTLSDFDDSFALENHWLAGLPDFNTENPETAQYLIDMAIWWIDQLGHDGNRLDTVRHVPHEFWEAFSSAIHAKYPNFYLVGESFDGDQGRVASYQRAGFDGMLDFPLYFASRAMIRDGESGADLARAMESAAAYPDRSRMGTFIDNHDVPRFINQVRNYKDEKLSQSLLFLYTYTGVPILYYGTELPIDAPGEHTSRRLFPWDQEVRFAGLVRVLADLRRELPALRSGEFRVVHADRHLVIYARQLEGQVLLTILNNSEVDLRIEIPVGGFSPLAAAGAANRPGSANGGSTNGGSTNGGATAVDPDASGGTSGSAAPVFRSAVEILGAEWLGAGTGAVASSFVEPRYGEAGETGLTASARAATVRTAENFRAEGVPSLAELLENGRSMAIRSGTLTVPLDAYTGSLLILSTESAGLPQWVFFAVGGGILLVIILGALLARRRRPSSGLRGR